MDDTLFSKLDSQALLITASTYLSRFFAKSYAQYKQQQQQQVWKTPNILTWDTWLYQYWSLNHQQQSNIEQQLILLSSHQELVVWEKIINDDENCHQLLQIGATAKAASDARRLLYNWQLDIEADDWQQNQDYQAFFGWNQRFDSICEQEHWLDFARLPHWLATEFESDFIELPSHIITAGFTEMTPIQARLLEKLRQKNIPIEALPLANPARSCQYLPLKNSQAEIQTAAIWSRQILEQQPDATIAIVSHDLSTQKHQIEQALQDIFLPNYILPDSKPTELPYKVSLGQPLSHYPIIAVALIILDMAKGFSNLTKLSILLRSPFIQGAREEQSQRALLDAWLREHNEQKISFNNLQRAIKHCQSKNNANCRILEQHVQRWQTLIINIAYQKKPSQWVITFNELLECFGWPEGRTLNSVEYQIVQAWNKILSELTRLDAVLPKIPIKIMLSRLYQLADYTIFQASSEESPIHVMSIPEIAGMYFDYVWVIGLHDRIWPASPKPNPFIPLNVQKQQKIPHATATQELQLAKHLSNILIRSATQIIFSYPQREQDSDLRPSPLLLQFDETNLDQLQLPAFECYQDIIHQSSKLEQLHDQQAPALAEGEIVKGGTEIIKRQAACPFSAFAFYRLGAKNLAQGRQGGLHPSERGSLIHSVLEQIWQHYSSQQQLIDESEAVLEKKIRQFIQQAIDNLDLFDKKILDTKLIKIEKQELFHMVKTWLELEKQRPPFTIHATEISYQVTIAQCVINTKVDRIDNLHNDQQIIIDYKTGQTDTKYWFGERPDEPQLPLYAISKQNQISGVAFAQVRLGEMKFKGITQFDHMLPKVASIENHKLEHCPNDWSELLQQWQHILHQLGEDYRLGHANVDPKEPNKTCQFCGLQTLCRVHSLKK